MAAVHEAQVANKNTIKPSVMKKCTSPGQICVSSHAKETKHTKRKQTKQKAAQENQQQQTTERGRSPNKNNQQHSYQGTEKRENLPMSLHFKAKNEFMCPEFTQRMQLNCLPNSPR